MSRFATTGIPGDDEILFLPLGGAGEIGMNLNLYGHAGKWLMVDCGITFDDGTTPGIDVIMPDPMFIEEHREDLIGLVLTHAHEDHLGALPYMWERLECPVYATPFTAAVLRRKLGETDFGDRVPVIEIPMSGTVDLTPFTVKLITLTHSIPEPNALIISSPAGDVMHTGDWKLDPDPMVGPSTDEQALIEAGENGVLAMVCDSTNAMSPGKSGSEGDVRDALIDVVMTAKGRVAVACFASNVARVESAAKAAEASGRHPVLVGRSLHRMVEAAKSTGYLKDLPPFLDDDAAASLPPEKVLLICTGSQGEPRAALTRIARQDHPTVTLGEGDTVIFSSREIPGNEVGIGQLQNRLTELGVRIVTSRDADIHTSGHPNRDELTQMYQWIRPHIAIPVHGEYRHLSAHAGLARECQVPHVHPGKNGDVLSLTRAGAKVVDEVYTGRLAYDGKRLTPINGDAIRERKRMIWNGCAVVSVVMEGKELISDAEVTAFGLFEEDEENAMLEQVAEAAEDAIDRMKGKRLEDDDAVSETVRVAVRRCLQGLTGKRPPVTVHLHRL
ncbi:MAG: ribonuclease J [Alphaproteobacteria bacterium]